MTHLADQDAIGTPGGWVLRAPTGPGATGGPGFRGPVSICFNGPPCNTGLMLGCSGRVAGVLGGGQTSATTSKDRRLAAVGKSTWRRGCHESMTDMSEATEAMTWNGLVVIVPWFVSLESLHPTRGKFCHDLCHAGPQERHKTPANIIMSNTPLTVWVVVVERLGCDDCLERPAWSKLRPRHHRQSCTCVSAPRGKSILSLHRIDRFMISPGA